MSHGHTSPEGEYPPIADHGIIGDLQTTALVGRDGTIDFLCVPEPDSPTVFASLLDAGRGGRFVVAPILPDVRTEQRYVRDTNVLVTRFVADGAEVEVVDFMPISRRPRPSRIVRLARVVHGSARVRCLCAPRFDYARHAPEVRFEERAASFTAKDGITLRLATRAPLSREGDAARAEILLDRGEQIAFVLELVGPGAERDADDRWAARALRRTIVYWRRWINKSTYRGEWHAAVRRSALALKLLQSRSTGAIIAAPTFGLPEQIGGARNWDFRYAWIRDSAFTVYALGRIGLKEEARAFSRWIAERCAEAPSPGALQSLYRFDGRSDVAEETLDHLEGYRRSRPIRVGNAAADQLQLDIYGELLDALHQQDEHAERTGRALWTRIVELTEWVARNWTRPDQGIWEVRRGSREFLFSRLMCWVAIDRAIRIAVRRRLPAPRDEWRRVRDAIRESVHQHFWNDALGAYVGARDGDTVDAACLTMPLVGFIHAEDPKWLSTLRAVETRLVRDGLVRRYDMMDMDTDAGSVSAPSFTICSFWYVECLARAGELERATQAMRRLLGYANHLGLYSEDLGATGEQLGNFPQGLVHAGLIGAAIALSG